MQLGYVVKYSEERIERGRSNVMGRASTKENKNIYQLSREALGYTREKASELLEWISPERIERIESEKSSPHPDEVLVMSTAYQSPELCNHYCANQCPIGQHYVPEVKIKNLSQIVLEMLASLNAMHKRKERLIEITADGEISGDEIEDFVYIQEELERISITVETLQLWSEQMLASGAIDTEAYQQYKKERRRPCKCNSIYAETAAFHPNCNMLGCFFAPPGEIDHFIPPPAPCFYCLRHTIIKA